MRNNRSSYGKPNLVFLFKEGSTYAYPLNNLQYRESYRDIWTRAEQYFSLYIVRGTHHHRGNGTFACGYQFSHGHFRKQTVPIAACVVFDKDHGGLTHAKHERDWVVVNDPAMARLLRDKHTTYNLFRKYMKRQWRVYTRSDCVRALKYIHGSMAVYKPHCSFGGTGVVIAPAKKIMHRLDVYNGIITEFIDTSHGIPGITSSYHDMRVVVMNGIEVESYVRMPKTGSYVSNIAQGGSYRYIPLTQIPSSARTIVQEVDRRLQCYRHRVYSIDFGFEYGVPFIIEMNEQPGIPFKTDGITNYTRWHRKLITIFRACARETKN